MNILSWVLGISFLVTTVAMSISFHEATVCRQEAWRGSFILSSRLLLSDPPEKESLHSPRCKVWMKRSESDVSWVRDFKSHSFKLDLRGKL